MRKLLRSEFARLFRDKILLISALVMFVAGTALPVIHYLDNRNSGAAWTPDSTLFTFAFILPVLLPVFTSLFIGCEYSDGTMRNKLIVGHRRHNIYLVNLAVSVFAGFIMSAAYILPHTLLGFLLLGKADASIKTIILYTLLVFALSVAFCAVFTLISMLCQNKAYSAAACILLTFALFFAGIRITSALNEPEYYSAYSFTENGVTTSEDAAPNPNYIGGTKREVYKFLKDFTSGGQVIQLANMKSEYHRLLALYNAIILIAATSCGIVVFRRKDLR